MAMTTNAQRFVATFRKAFTETYPSMKWCPELPTDPDALSAVLKASTLTGSALRATCKDLGISPTREALDTYIKGDE
jgi:hypothetical protein